MVSQRDDSASLSVKEIRGSWREPFLLEFVFNFFKSQTWMSTGVILRHTLLADLRTVPSCYLRVVSCWRWCPYIVVARLPLEYARTHPILCCPFRLFFFKPLLIHNHSVEKKHTYSVEVGFGYELTTSFKKNAFIHHATLLYIVFFFF
jgi:hypothetical protein